MKKNIITKAATLATALLMTVSFLAGCGGSATNGGGAVNTDPNVKPAEIRLMLTTSMTFENGLQYVADKFEENQGIKLTIEKPDHNQYYEKVNLSFAGGTAPDAVELGSIQYPTFATQGALWDMAEAYETSDAPMKSVIDDKYVEALRIDGKLYGFPLAKGGGTVTYVRQDWMEELGVEDPTNYEEFLEMLRKFKTKKLSSGQAPIPITAAGLINTESPYEIYLREFYQDAKPYIYKDENTGKYIDGMSQQPMKDALQRMADAYKEGLIDTEIVTNKTSTCRDKFYADLVGCFNYWAGSWAKTLEENLVTSVPTAKLKALPAIEEGTYIERPATALSITSASTNPIGVYKYLIEYSHDGGEGQMLFTRGVENIHWEKKEDGTTVAMPYIETPDKLVEKAYYAPELSCTEFDDPIALDERITSSLEILYADSTLAEVPVVNDVIAVEQAELDTIRKEVISKVVLGELTPDEGIAEYEQRANGQITAILTSLNG